MASKSFFLFYKQASFDEIVFQGSSKPRTIIIALDAKEEEGAIKEATRKWNLICKKSRLRWSRLNNKNERIKLENAKLIKAGKRNKVKPLKEFPQFPEWKPFDQELITKVSLE